MCGIFGYTGQNQATSKLVDGLRLLEYRGYDSAGISVLNGQINTVKSEGNIDQLHFKLQENNLDGFTGIAHTRWATHGKATENNAHPHHSSSGRFSIVHNGIIENYDELKLDLVERGFLFHSDTDTEVLVNQLEFLVTYNGFKISEAIHELHQICEGNYSFAILDQQEKNTIYLSRKEAPLIIGKATEGVYLSSDIHTFNNNCIEIYFLKDLDIISIHHNSKVVIHSETKKEVKFIPFEQFKEHEHTVKNNTHQHVTLSEIHEQPQVLARLINNQTHFDELEKIDLSKTKRIIMLACGTSLHAAMIAKWYIEKYIRIPVNVEQASEFSISDPLLFPSDTAIAISQSGETADTIAACKICLESGVRTIGITNSRFSTLAMICNANIYLNAGKETGVASTKAFSAQLMVFVQLISRLGKGQNDAFENSIQEIPNHIETILGNDQPIQEIAKAFENCTNFLFIGRGISYPMAMEGALKLKELSYIHAEGYQTAELKHGPLALIDKNFPVILLATEQIHFQRNLATFNEIKSRNGNIITFINKNQEDHWYSATKSQVGENDFFIALPGLPDDLMPFLSLIPLQLFSYYMALNKGCNVDQPRNLAKSVTVI